ncbi:M20/M25/M40 family metallo-hydrolase [Parahaliea aestuarii]|uniref:M20/M25/M40 family metallo-hydrolase n=1 Tax=Parahaliea aestuarii TaxID=1852021 RepID=A0A5C8ZPB4_9GAMM|nr:M20/M25/M40 family metallo-hydrolase [Parahaliea aestuarii]TXS89604.1 M20/M25/M40 family metallo-hydrolase [Parahaliea aestuarii]
MRSILTVLLAFTLPVQALAEAPAGQRAIQADKLSETVKVMASDAFEGRAPGTPGEDKTVDYLVQRMQAIGLEPGGPDGQWTQAVPMMRTLVQTPAQIAFATAGSRLALEQGVDIALATAEPRESIKAEDVPLVFVGFGVSAPEQDWDDYGDIDLSGKIAVFLVNDPDFAAAPGEPAAGRFGNRRMTYYGRWAYKYEEAARRGALGALVIHETGAAGYNWSVAAAGPGEQVALAEPPAGTPSITVQGWLHNDAATKLLAMAGEDLDALRVAARRPDFQAFELPGVHFNASLAVQVSRFDSRNVLGLLPGTERPGEVLMASAHWDAFGLGEPDAQGRTVHPGANDDALGSAGVLEIARVLKAGPPLERSVLFAFWTAEESGLMGSKAYAADPVYPLETTVANFTLDILQTAGAARDVILVGKGQSELEDDMVRVAAQQNRYVTEENLPENGLFYRADHFSMAREGVPVLLIMGIAGGADLVEGGREAGNQWISDYVGNCYHKTCDAWSADWDLTGAVQDIELIRQIIEDLADSSRWPQWKDGSEFKATRDASRAARQ